MIPLMLGQVLLDQIVYGNVEIVCFPECLLPAESFCNDSVQSGVGAGDGVCTTHHTQPKLVASGEKQTVKFVTVGGILIQIRQSGYAGHQANALDGMSSTTGSNWLRFFTTSPPAARPEYGK